MRTGDYDSFLPKIRRIGKGLDWKSVENFKSKLKDSISPVINNERKDTRYTHRGREVNIRRINDNSSASPLLNTLMESYSMRIKKEIVIRNPIRIDGRKFTQVQMSIPKIVIENREKTQKILKKIPKCLALKKKIFQLKKSKILKVPEKKSEKLLKPLKIPKSSFERIGSGISLRAWD